MKKLIVSLFMLALGWADGKRCRGGEARRRPEALEPNARSPAPKQATSSGGAATAGRGSAIGPGRWFAPLCRPRAGIGLAGYSRKEVRARDRRALMVLLAVAVRSL